MGTVVDELRASHVTVNDDHITAYLADGRMVSVPLWWSWRLEQATQAQRDRWEMIGDGYGFHWPDVDEDLSVEGMIFGTPAPRPGPNVYRYLRKPRSSSTTPRRRSSRS
jgi:uncharacterized protein DUF2442